LIALSRIARRQPISRTYCPSIQGARKAATSRRANVRFPPKSDTQGPITLQHVPSKHTVMGFVIHDQPDDVRRAFGNPESHRIFTGARAFDNPRSHVSSCPRVHRLLADNFERLGGQRRISVSYCGQCTLKPFPERKRSQEDAIHSTIEVVDCLRWDPSCRARRACARAGRGGRGPI